MIDGSRRRTARRGFCNESFRSKTTIDAASHPSKSKSKSKQRWSRIDLHREIPSRCTCTLKAQIVRKRSPADFHQPLQGFVFERTFPLTGISTKKKHQRHLESTTPSNRFTSAIVHFTQNFISRSQTEDWSQIYEHSSRTRSSKSSFTHSDHCLTRSPVPKKGSDRRRTERSASASFCVERQMRQMYVVFRTRKLKIYSSLRRTRNGGWQESEDDILQDRSYSRTSFEKVEDNRCVNIEMIRTNDDEKLIAERYHRCLDLNAVEKSKCQRTIRIKNDCKTTKHLHSRSRDTI